ncbi:MAG TPA: carboxymuconolactone decarboxylase family protein [Microthrixaceae bacterium]|nr:carboxymuconolactone decarboxylase family protein [Microthrixaceae bacterium]
MSDSEADGSEMSESEARAERRRRGIERMGEVYNFEVGDGPGAFYGYTLEHLFGDIWERPGLSIRDRRLLLIGLMVGEGLSDTLQVQLDSALDKGELSAEQLEEIVVFMSHYAGWPKGAGLNNQVSTAIARHNRKNS